MELRQYTNATTSEFIFVLFSNNIHCLFDKIFEKNIEHWEIHEDKNFISYSETRRNSVLLSIKNNQNEEWNILNSLEQAVKKTEV